VVFAGTVVVDAVAGAVVVDVVAGAVVVGFDPPELPSLPSLPPTGNPAPWNLYKYLVVGVLQLHPTTTPPSLVRTVA
jgi:hypothetical protein